MAGKIDKLRTPVEGLLSFVGTGVATIPDRLEDREDVRALIHEEVEDIRVEIEAGPEQYSYLFASIKKVEEHITNLYQEINNFTVVSRIVCLAYLDTTMQNIDSGLTGIDVLLDTAFYDPQSMFNASTNRIIVPEDGRYLVTFCVVFANIIANESYFGKIRSDGVSGDPYHITWTSDNSGSGMVYVKRTVLLDLSAGDYIKLMGGMSTIDPDNQVDITGGWPYDTSLLVIKIN